jgi:hypothetical protein
MSGYAASALRRGRVSREDLASLAFLERAQRLAIRRAARDAHRTECPLDAFDCPICQGHARAITDAKRTLNGETS